MYGFPERSLTYINSEKSKKHFSLFVLGEAFLYQICIFFFKITHTYVLIFYEIGYIIGRNIRSHLCVHSHVMSQEVVQGLRSRRTLPRREARASSAGAFSPTDGVVVQCSSPKARLVEVTCPGRMPAAERQQKSSTSFDLSTTTEYL